MSLVKQLWLAIVLVMGIAFGGSMAVSVLSARTYMEQQLQIKNIDNATSLALSLTQLPKDPVTIELQIASQFDAGHYRYIRVTSPTGTVLAERVFTGAVTSAPAWFIHSLPMHVDAGQALIQDGWKQYGVLELASHEMYAYKGLWDGALELLGWFVLGAVLAGLAGSFLLQSITRPLLDVVRQAAAIVERRFLTIAEPRTPELRSLARAMNEMVDRLKAAFGEESTRLEALRQKANHDGVTGLANREYFLSHLQDVLGNDQAGASGSLVLVRLPNLDALNAMLGHLQTDVLLGDIGAALKANALDREGQRVGRIKGSEIGVISPDAATATGAGAQILEVLLRDVLPRWQSRVPDLFHIAAVRYRRGQTLGDLLSRADQAAALASGAGPNAMHATENETEKSAFPAQQWRSLIAQATADGQLQLEYFPVLWCKGGGLLHHEGVVRMQTQPDSPAMKAGDFMPMAAQLRMTAPVDLRVIRLAMDGLRAGRKNIAVNLATQTVADFHFRNELIKLLKAAPEVCPRLWFEVPEYGAFQKFDAFCDLSRALKELRCHIGLEFFGQHFSEGDKLVEMGLDYIKVDPSYTHALAENSGNQEFLQGLCKAVHSLGITVVALGIQDAQDMPLLAGLGFDAATGPGVR